MSTPRFTMPPLKARAVPVALFRPLDTFGQFVHHPVYEAVLRVYAGAPTPEDPLRGEKPLDDNLVRAGWPIVGVEHDNRFNPAVFYLLKMAPESDGFLTPGYTVESLEARCREVIDSLVRKPTLDWKRLDAALPVPEKLPVGAFAYSCALQFNDGGPGIVVTKFQPGSYEAWSFGDDDVGSIYRPVVEYRNGTYTVEDASNLAEV